MKTPLKVTLIAITAVIALVIGAIIYTTATRPQAPQDDNAAAALPGARSNSHVLDSAGRGATKQGRASQSVSCGALWETRCRIAMAQRVRWLCVCCRNSCFVSMTDCGGMVSVGMFRPAPPLL